MDFQTPIPVVNKMISMIPRRVKTVLEPTPGEGNIVDCLLDKGFEVTAPHDFFQLGRTLRFDCIVMNPPFSPMKLGYEILYGCMEMSDNVIALMPWLTLINSGKRTDKIKEYGLKSITHLPRSIFSGSRVQTCILEMERNYTGITEFKIY